MQNLELYPFNRKHQKRSVESLLEDSAIDNEPAVINFEILQMKKAYNETYKSFNSKIQILETDLKKYKQKCKKLEQANTILSKRLIQTEKDDNEYSQMKIYCEKMKRKVLYIEGKYQKLVQNRKIVQRLENQINEQQMARNGQENINETNHQCISKSQVYRQISELIAAKIGLFTNQLRLHAMTKQLEQKIELFLQELIYITPISAIEGIKWCPIKQNSTEKIPSKQIIMLSEQKAWQQLSRTVYDNTKQVNESNKQTAQKKKQNLFNYYNQEKQNQKQTQTIKIRLNEPRDSQYRPSPKKAKIFPNN